MAVINTVTGVLYRIRARLYPMCGFSNGLD